MLGKTSLSFASPVNPFSEEVTSFFLLIITRHEIFFFFKTKSDVEPFKVLKYNNEDGGNSFVHTITDKQVNSISFQLKNERDEYITDCPDYLMVVQYNIYEKEDHTIKNSLISINKIMSELYTALIFAMNRLKLLL